MNIKITYNWLLEYLDTDASPYDLMKFLALTGPGVERVDKVGDDYVLDIEVTSNRVDSASVFGIAQEAQAIISQFGKKAKLKFNPLSSYRFDTLAQPETVLPIKLELLEKDLASRATMIVMRDVTVKPSPEFIAKRLELCDVRAINNVVDTSNYLMLALGQPVHTFDYDRIKGHLMKMRTSKKGEKLTTLDDKEFVLPGGDIVIEDGSGKLIDLAGIMGGQLSEVHEGTKNVLLYVQTYNKRKIRRTSMTTGQRSMAATFFEKGLDEERVEPTLVYGVKLLEKYAGGKVASPVHDIYPEPYKAKGITVEKNEIDRLIGVTIPDKQVHDILENLGFKMQKLGKSLIVTVPSWRKDDIEVKEDITEEVARVYGYHNLPNNLPPLVFVKQPVEIEQYFKVVQKLKVFLKHVGLHESMNYSMVSERMLTDLDIKPSDTLELANTISEEIKYMRPSLVPSLVRNLKKNEGKADTLKFFEFAKIYKPRKGDLPEELNRLGIAVNTSFFDLKGIVEALLRESHITTYAFKSSSNDLYLPGVQSELVIGGEYVGTFGELKPLYAQRAELNKSVFIAEFDMEPIIHEYRTLPKYRAAHGFAVIKLDATIELTDGLTYAEIVTKANKSSNVLQKIEILDQYKNNLTLRFYFSSAERNLTETEAKSDLEKIKQTL